MDRSNDDSNLFFGCQDPSHICDGFIFTRWTLHIGDLGSCQEVCAGLFAFWYFLAGYKCGSCPTAIPTASPTSPTSAPSASPTSAPSPGSECLNTPFQSNMELYSAVDDYLRNNSVGTDVANTYGHPIGTWCVGQVTSFTRLFSANTRNPRAMNFNEDIGSWDTGNVDDFFEMFTGATKFNQDLRWWNTSKVTDVRYMFYNAELFNQDLSGWDVSKTTAMTEVVRGAKAFRQNLCAWGDKLDPLMITDYNDMFLDTNCPTTANPDFSSDPKGPFCFECPAPSR